MTAYFAMDGYGIYVWPAFGISLVVLTGTLWLTKRNLKQTQKRILRRIRSQEGMQ